MIKFEVIDSHIILTYYSDRYDAVWLDRKLSHEGGHTFYRTFSLTLNRQQEVDTDQDETRRFAIGYVADGYYVIYKDVLGTKYDLLLSTDLILKKELFVAQGDISIFRKIDELINEPIVIGGGRDGAVSLDVFKGFIKKFPTRTEMVRYAEARIANVLGEYFETMTDAEQKLIDFMKRKGGSNLTTKTTSQPIVAASRLDYEKYTYLRNKLSLMLGSSDGIDESTWQKLVSEVFILIYPQYITVLENVSLKELYSNPGKPTLRKFDLVLVNANGCIDLIEIKKPFADSLVSKGKYRDNHIPKRELSGAIMQAEKYLFYLNKAGRSIENSIERDYKKELPHDIEIRVASPKAIILNGRDHNLTKAQKIDLEFIRRKYSNIVDILSYDDLLRRLDNVIEALGKRIGEDD